MAGTKRVIQIDPALAEELATHEQRAASAERRGQYDTVWHDQAARLRKAIEEAKHSAGATPQEASDNGISSQE